MGIHQPIRKTVIPEIPDKLYFRIGDVARLCEVPAYVLRFWETEFPQLKPNKGGTGQRLYRKRDVEMALRIKSLLYDQGYTIPGARQVFKSEARVKDVTPAAAEPVPVLAARTSAAVVEPALPTATGSLASEDVNSVSQAAMREIRLRALRDDLQSLLTMLSAAPGASGINAAGSGRATGSGTVSPKLQAFRPRLVSSSVADSSGLKLTSARLSARLADRLTDRNDQPDLFPPPTQFE